MAQAEKLIETKKEGEYETRKYHIKYFTFEIDRLDDIWERESDDYESAYYNGMIGDMDGELYYIEVDAFLRFCQSEIEEIKEEGEENTTKNGDDYAYLMDVLKSWEGYTIYVQRNEESADLKEKTK